MNTNQQTANQQSGFKQTYDSLKSWKESIQKFAGDCEEDATFRILNEFNNLSEEEQKKFLPQTYQSPEIEQEI